MKEDEKAPLFSVLDTSAFFLQVSIPGRLYTVRRVADELKDLRGKARLAVLVSQGLYICEPDPDSVQKVTGMAEKSGDRSVLSETDIDLLALALQIGGTLFSDDFAMHNTAQYLNIPVHPLMQKKAKTRRWKIRCSGCGRYLEEMPPDSLCQICGSLVKRKIK
ncbi:MAG: nucleotide-binding protein [Methanospirillum sp.]|nr:nucleotide-binding protein [Methanospirillum sp.]